MYTLKGERKHTEKHLQYKAVCDKCLKNDIIKIWWSGYINKTDNNQCWEGCGETGSSHTADENVKWCSHFGNQSSSSSKR